MLPRTVLAKIRSWGTWLPFRPRKTGSCADGVAHAPCTAKRPRGRPGLFLPFLQVCTSFASAAAEAAALAGLAGL